MSIANINALLEDKLFQVIGSTPTSIAESLNTINLKGKKTEGMQIFAISIFAAAVNKPTLETFLADPRFGTVRQLLISALNIQGKSNMTAITLLGHCLLTTDEASDVVFASEFRKKMGQNHLWAGELNSGSLSDKQREILKEKRRVTTEKDAKALGSGFLKLTGLRAGTFEGKEIDFFGAPGTTTASSPKSASRLSSGTIPRPATGASSSRYATSPPASTNLNVSLNNGDVVSVPVDVMNYRTEVLGRSISDIVESIEATGVDDFITRTRKAIARDPTGNLGRAASTTG